MRPFISACKAAACAGLSLWCGAASAQALVVLHAFASVDGANPAGTLVLSTDGNFYGTTFQGGANNTGVVYVASQSGAVMVLHAFPALGAGGANGDGARPSAALVRGTDGNFYGTTTSGGSAGNGTVYKITPAGTFTLLHAFPALGAGGVNTDGAVPNGALIQGTDGNLYGTTVYGGASGSGTAYRLSTSGSSFTVLHSFASADGANPYGGLVQANDGKFYGVTYDGGADNFGTVYQITTAPTFTALYAFTGGSDGAYSHSSLIQATDGQLYGATTSGGVNDVGAIFKITTAGVITPLLSFNLANGAYPYDALAQATDGDFYGTTRNGGAAESGTVFRITSTGGYALLHSFPIAPHGTNSEGAEPLAGLVEGPDGNFYGTAFNAGAKGYGTLFVLNPNPGAPVVTAVTPSAVNAAGPSFTLKVTGKSFLSTSVVHWNGAALTTTYVSSTSLTAAVPAADITTPAIAYVNVATTGAGLSDSKAVTINQTTLKLGGVSLTRNSGTGVITARIHVVNVGHLSASAVTIQASTLASAATTTPLPLAIGTIAPGTSAVATLTYPGTAGAPGTSAVLRVSGSFTGGSFAGSKTVTLP